MTTLSQLDNKAFLEGACGLSRLLLSAAQTHFLSASICHSNHISEATVICSSKGTTSGAVI